MPQGVYNEVCTGNFHEIWRLGKLEYKYSAIEMYPDKLSGVWVFLGTRVPISTLFENLRDAATMEQLLKWFPGVNRHQVKTVLAHERLF